MKLCFTCSCNWKTNLYWKYKKGPYINDADTEGKGRYNESKIFLDVVRGGRRGDCCSFRRPLSIFFTLQNATNRVQEFPVIFSSLSVSKRSAQPQQRIIFGMSVSCFMCFVWMFWCSELAKCFFLLWTFIWVYETTEIIFPWQQLKFQPIRNHDQITRHTAVWVALAQMTKYGYAISWQKINFPAEHNICFDTFRKSIEVFSVK